MIKKLLNYIFIFATFFSLAQITPTNVGFNWAYKTFTSYNDIKLDGKGYFCVVGEMSGVQNFDFFNAGVSGVSQFTSNGNNDIIICKYDINLNLVWARQIGGVDEERANTVCFDTLGNVIVSGIFWSTIIDMDPGAGVYNLYFPSSGGQSGPCASYVLKLSPSGNFLWADGFEGSSIHSLQFNAVTTDLNNNIYCTGGFRDTADFDPSPLVYSLSVVGLKDAFILKLNSGGNFVTVKRFGSPNAICMGNGIMGGQLGSLYWSGNISGNSVNLNPNGVFNITPNPGATFISKLSTSFGFQWADSYNMAPTTLGCYFALDANENVYARGNFSATVDFDPSPATYDLTSTGGKDIYITKVNNLGNFVWAKQLGGGFTNALANGISLDNLGNVYTTGQFATAGSGTITLTPIDLDPGPSVYNFVSNGNFDIFINKLDNNGNFVWAKQMGGLSQDIGTALAIDNGYHVYTIGLFGATVDFDPGIGISNLSNSNGLSGFIQKLSPCNAPVQPSLFNYTGCSGQSSTLIAIGTGTINWFNSAVVNTLAASGFTYFTSPLSAGIYTFYATANNTCAPSQPMTTVTLNIGNQQTVNLAALSYTICNGETVTLTASGAANYTWALSSNTIAQTVVVQPNATSNVTLIATGNSTVCPAIRVVTISVNKCTGISVNNLESFELRVYPNPATSVLIVEGLDLSGIISISNLLGEIVLQKNKFDTSQSFDISALPSGVYFVQLLDKNKLLFSKKVIKE